MSLQFFQHPLLSNILIVIHPPNISKSGIKNQMSVWLQIYWQSVEPGQIRRCVLQIYWWSVSPDTRIVPFSFTDFSENKLLYRICMNDLIFSKGGYVTGGGAGNLSYYIFTFSLCNHISSQFGPTCICLHSNLISISIHLHKYFLFAHTNIFYSPTQIFSIHPYKYFPPCNQIFVLILNCSTQIPKV